MFPWIDRGKQLEMLMFVVRCVLISLIVIQHMIPFRKGEDDRKEYFLTWKTSWFSSLRHDFFFMVVHPHQRPARLAFKAFSAWPLFQKGRMYFF